MFHELTWDENNALFMVLHRAFIATDKRVTDLLAAPDERFRPVMDTAHEITGLMSDLAAAL